jgi:hypothetical protein
MDGWMDGWWLDSCHVCMRSWKERDRGNRITGIMKGGLLFVLREGCVD